MSIQPNAQLDKEGRIIWLAPETSIKRGHSVCYHCKKDMPDVWEVICSTCRHTFCYADAIAMFNNWYCKECFEHALTQALTDLAKFTMFSHNGAAGPKSCAGCAALERHRDLIVCVTDLDIEIEP